MSPRRAFTLWEMALVLLVMGVAAGLAVPAFARLGAADERAEGVDELLQLLRASRRAAVAHGVTVTLVVDPASGRWRADSAGALGAGELASGTLALGGAGALATELPRLRYLFRATGAAQADTVRVRDDRASGGAALVLVDAWSGEPRATR
jgi:prepilin-type N-terminal cleavage/methylation domain-containing protein